MSKLISIITPTYNEKDNITYFITAVSQMMIKLRLNYEIIVVDDNSPDGTGRIVEKLKSKNPNIKLIKRKGKLGIGSAYFDGFQSAKGDYLIALDADLSPGVNTIPKFIEALDAGKQMVIGSRYLPSSVIINVTKFKSNGSKLFNHFVKNVLRIPLSDITHSNRAFTKDAFIQIAPHITENSHPAFFIECSFWAHRLNYQLGEIPITFTERDNGQSKLNINKGLRKSLGTVARLFNLHFKRTK